MLCPTFRFTFMANPDKRVIVVRPIGDMPADLFMERLFESYATVTMPWTYNRLLDLRRFDGHLRKADYDAIAARWQAITAGRDYEAYVAIVGFDAFDDLRIPHPAPNLPNEVICHFSDFHEAMGWLTATDRAGFLARLRPPQRVRRDDGRIRVE
jgi:hypothetical protein